MRNTRWFWLLMAVAALIPHLFLGLSDASAASPGYAIVVPANVSFDADGSADYYKTGNRVKQSLAQRGITDITTIYTGKSSLQNAIQVWARDKMNADPAPLYIVVINHGNTDQFYLGSETVSATELNSWLETMEAGITPAAQLQKRVVILGFCYSGTFINNLSRSGRVVISSSAADEVSYRGPGEPDGVRGGEYFIEQLFAELARGISLKKAFNAATESVRGYLPDYAIDTVSQFLPFYLDGARQHPLLDDDGDGIGSNSFSDDMGDGLVADALTVGTLPPCTANTPGCPTVLSAVAETLFMDENSTTAPVWAKPTDASRTRWIINENINMTYNSATGAWEQNVAIDPGMNVQSYHLIENNTNLAISPLRTSVVYRAKPGNTPPAPFGLTEPASGSTRPGVLAFRWDEAADSDGDAVTYTFLMSRSSDFSTIDLKRELLLYPAFGVDGTAGLQAGTTYYWKVQAVDAYGSITESSQTGSVTIDNSGGVPVLIEGHTLSLYSGQPIVGAAVWSSNGGSTTTTANGYFVFATPSGSTTVTASTSGFVQAVKNIAPQSGGKVHLKFPLEPTVRPNLTVNFKGPGYGTVESIPAGLTCSTGGSCSGAATAPTMKLVVSPTAPHTVLSRWEGGCYGSGDCTVQMTADKTVTAIFATAPGAMTTSSASFGDTWAEFSGLVNTNELTSESRFAYRQLPSGTWQYTSWLKVDYGSFGSYWSQVRSSVYGLLPLATYEYRIEARNAQGSTSSTTTASVTLKGSAPYASTGTASNLTSSGVTIAGTVTPRGNATDYWFEYGTTTSYGSATPRLSAGSDPAANVSVSASLSGLLPSTTYFYRLVASNQYGTAYGASGSFYTPYSGSLTGFGLIKDIYLGTGSSSPKALVEYNNVLYFSADTMTPTPTYTWYGRELMRSDGTMDGTFLVKDISPGAAGFDPIGMYKIGGYIYFTGSWPTSIYRTNGTAAGTVNVFTSTRMLYSMVASGDKLFFWEQDINFVNKLWTTNGTTNTMVKDGLYVTGMSPWSQGIFMNVQTTAEGTELWKSDGTTAGTVMIKDINPGTASSSPSQVVQVGSTWLFSANDGVNGSELWRTDGTTAGTVMVKDICPGTCTSMYGNITVMDGIAYFWASDGVSGSELWRSDGTEAGTWLVKDIYPGTYSSTPYEVIVENNLLFFNTEIPGTGRELWRSDGTPEGTFMVKDIHPVSTAMYVYPTGMRGVYGKVYFQANDGVSGAEPWVTDGTSAGTTLLRDIYPGSGSSNPSSFTGVAGNLYFAATAPGTGTELYYQALTTYSVTPSAGPNGRINPGTGLILSEGVSGRFSVTPDPGYRIASVTGCGGSMSGNIFTTAPLSANCTITAAFEPDTFQVTITAGINGSITGLTTVPRNAQPTYSIIPDTGYHVVDVMVNGTSVGAVSSYMFPTGITANATISATFAINTYSIAAAAGPNGTISGPTTVTFGETASYTITPASGYHIAEVLVDGINAGALSSYSFGPVSADHTITASFAINSYAVTLTAGVGGSISGPTMVNHGDLPTYSITPNPGYHTTLVRVDNVSVGIVSSYTFTTPVTAPKSITAYFAVNTYAITATAGSGGSITGPRSANHGTAATFSITPLIGYQVTDVLIDGVSVGALSSYTFSSVSQPHTISASFTISSYTITLDAGPGGSIIGPTKVVFGNNPAYTITPDNGYSITDVVVDGTSIGPVSSYTLPKVIAVDIGSNHTLTLLGDGSVWAYGANPYGQIGNGTSGTNIFTPTRVSGLPPISAVAGGGGHSVALAKDGTVWTWGSNMYGQLGIGSTIDSTVPVKVGGLAGVTAISAGMHHVMALRNDGTVWAWGVNNGRLGNGTITGSPVPVQMAGLSGITAVSAGTMHSVALKNDGSVWACGYNSYGEVGNGTITSVLTPVQVPNVSGVTAISAGQYITMILKSDGSVWSWGSNYEGELGNGTTVRSLVPVQPAGLSGVKAIAAASSHSLALKKDGTVWAWGSNLDGQLGDGTTTNRLAPVQVNGLSGVIAVRGGAWYSTALKDDATLRGWGQNAYGQLGIGGSAVDFLTPTQSAIGVITADKTISARFTIKSYTISATSGSNGTIAGPATVTYGSSATYAIKPAPGYLIASVIVDGVNFGAITGYTFTNVTAGHTITATFSLPPLVIATAALPSGLIDTPYSQVLTATGGKAPYSWSITGGALPAGLTLSSSGTVNGTATTAGTSSFTIQVTDAVGTTASALLNITVLGPFPVTAPRVAAGRLYSVTLKADGTVWAWGVNSAGQVGDGTTTQRLAPVQVKGLSGITALSAGDGNTLALKNDGTVWAWGFNGNGNLGDGTTTTRLTPLQVGGLTDVIAIAAGVGHSLALKKDGTVWAWGDNRFGQLGDGTTTQHLTPVQATSLSGVTAIAAGSSHTVVLKGDGTVWTLGWNGYGNLGDGTTVNRSTPAQVSGLDGIIAIDASTVHTVALKNDGTVWAWGYNGYGQLGDGTIIQRLTPVQVSDLSGITAVSANQNNTVALKNDGTVWASGWNIYGQVGDGTTTLRQTPTQVTGLNGIIAISAGDSHSVALKDNGTIWSWGHNAYGQIGDGTTVNRPVAVQTGTLNLIVVRITGTSPTDIPQGASYTFTPAAVGATSFSITNKPAWALFDPASGTLSGTPGAADTGTSSGIIITAKNGAYIDSLPPFAITVHGPVAISVTAGSGGTVNGPAAITYGGSASYSITPAIGYHLVDVLVDGSSVGTVTNYTFTNAKTDHTISASFAIDTFTITATSGGNGSVIGPVSADYASNATFSISPAAGYYVADVLVDGVTVGAVTSYTFTNVTANHTISATFALQPLAITTTTLPNGTTGSAYSQTLAATGGLAPYSWSITSGALPAGLTLSSSGVISGTPTVAGAANFTVQVKDAVGTSVARPLAFTVTKPDLIITTISGPTAITRGTTKYVFSATVKNQGSGSSAAAKLGFYLSTGTTISTTVSKSNYLVGTASLPALAAGTSTTISLTLSVPTSVAVGSYYIGAYADSGNTVAELSETNNGKATVTKTKVK